MTETIEVFLFLDQSEVLLTLIHDSDGFLVSLLPDIEDMVSLRDEVSGFAMHLLDEWTRRIDPSHIPRSKLSKIARSCPMSRYDDKRILGNLLEIRLKYDSLSLEHLHDKSIVDDLMIHIYRCRMVRHDFHKHTDSTMDSCAVATGIGSENRKCHTYFLFFHSFTFLLRVSLAFTGFCQIWTSSS